MLGFYKSLFFLYIYTLYTSPQNEPCGQICLSPLVGRFVRAKLSNARHAYTRQIFQLFLMGSNIEQGVFAVLNI